MTRRKTCLTCGSTKLTKIIDLGMHPYADTFIDKKHKSMPLPVYNLSCAMCEECKLIQTETATDATERYNLFDYSYTSSNSLTSRSHWEEYCESISHKLSLSKESTIYEIGSNDGYLLSQFKNKLNNKVYGIDASRAMCDIANEAGIFTENCVFNQKESDRIVKKVGPSDLVIANNVYNHSDDPISFTMGVNTLLKNGGHYVFEVPYWKSTIDSKKIDQIYHEHVTYYTITSLKNLLEKCKFEIVNIEVVDYHGGSLRVTAKKNLNEKISHYKDITKQIKKESYLFEKKTYEVLNKHLLKRKIDFVSKIIRYKKKGYNIIAIGAAAKGNTLLNFLNLNNSLIDFVTDTSKYKQGKATPLSDIQICGDEVFATVDKVCGLILSWNLSEPIKNKIREINPNIEYINFYK
jgi:SAM-dependent methyltransferase